MPAIRRFDWSRENIRHSDVILVSHWLSSACRFLRVIIVEYVSNYSVLNQFNLVNILSAKGPKKSRIFNHGTDFVYSLSLFFIFLT